MLMVVKIVNKPVVHVIRIPRIKIIIAKVDFTEFLKVDFMSS